jgi:FkbM family methyltransferase
MSDINLQWLTDNFSNRPIVIYDIGCADIVGDSQSFKLTFPQAEIYAFECSHYWKEHNTLHASNMGIHYHHIAIADHCNGVTFYPSDKNYEQEWPWSGSIYSPDSNLVNVGLTFGEAYTVPSTTLNEFCKEHPTPNFIHIDAQGAEYSIFKDMEVYPEAIWAEIGAFHLYDTSITCEQFNDMMLSKGYIQKYIDHNDALYVYNDTNFTEYRRSK